MTRASDYIADVLHSAGVDTVFEVAGGMIAPLLDSFGRHNGIRVVTVHHEQAAAFAAEGYARFRHRPAVVLGTAGPGALNLLTGIASCFYDSIPAIFIGGQVQTYLQRKDRPVRQFGLQEVNFLAAASPFCKACYNVTRAGDIPDVLGTAFALSCSGRPGPVVIELPFDVQAAPLEAAPILPSVQHPPPADPEAVAQALELLRCAERPLIHAGSGVRQSGAAEMLARLSEGLSIPVTTTVLGRDTICTSHPCHLGMTGTYGVRAANLAMAEADAVLVLASRLDHGQIGADPASWARGKRIAQVDCDEGEMQSRVRSELRIACDVATFLAAALELCMRSSWPVRDRWMQRTRSLCIEHPDIAELSGCPGINPNLFMRELSDSALASAVFVVDNGLHTYWAAQSLRLRGTQRFLASTGLGAMGAALPMAVGAALASGGPVVAIAGDGAIQMNIQELQTIARNRFPVKTVVINNGCLGMVSRFQELAMEGRLFSTEIGYSAPDFVEIARSYGIPGEMIERPEEVRSAVGRLWSTEGPAMLDVRIDRELDVYPQVRFGRNLRTMTRYRTEAD